MHHSYWQERETTTYSEIVLQLLGHGSSTAANLPPSFAITSLQDERVTTYAAVNDIKQKLIHVGDFVQLDDRKVSDKNTKT